MQIASNVIGNILNTAFSKFDVGKALMLEFNIGYIANWYFGSDCQLQVMHHRKLFRLYSGKQNCVLCNV